MRERKFLILPFVIFLIMTLGFVSTANAFNCNLAGNSDGHCYTIDNALPDGSTSRTYWCGDISENHPVDCDTEGGSKED